MHPPLCSGCCVLCPLIASAYPQAPVGVVVGTATISPLALFPNVAFGYQHERVGLIVMDKQICLRAQFAHARLGWLVLSGILVLIPFPLIEGIVLDLFMLTMIYQNFAFIMSLAPESWRVGGPCRGQHRQNALLDHDSQVCSQWYRRVSAGTAAVDRALHGYVNHCRARVLVRIALPSLWW